MKVVRNLRIPALIFAALTGTVCLLNAAPMGGVLEQDGIKVVFDKPRGMMVEVDGVPFTSNSHLWVVNDLWNHHYAGYFQNPPFDGSFKREGNTISFILNGNFNEFEGKQSITLESGRKLKIQVDGKLTTDTDADFEFMTASVAAGWYAGRPYKVEGKDGSTTQGVFGIEPPKSQKLGDLVICPDIKRLEVDTVMGPVVMTVKGSHKMITADYRNNTWEDDTMLFVNGVFFERTSVKRPISMTIEYQFPPAKQETAKKTSETTTVLTKDNIIEDKVVAKPDAGADYIVPRPKKITWGKGTLDLPDFRLRVALQGAATTTDTKDMEMMVGAVDGALSRLYKGKAVKAQSPDKAQLILKLEGKSQPKKHDAYKITAGETCFTISAPTIKGLWAGIGAYRQLLRQADGKLGVRRADIDDYSVLPFRSIQFFTGKDSLDLHLKLFTQLLPLLRANPITYEIDYMEWTGFPGMLNKKYGAKNSDVRKIAQAARANGVEIVPLVNTYGHAEWMIDNPTYKHLADDPAKPFCYDAMNPEVYRICRKIYEETLEIFQPSIVHIGHDEIYAPNFPLNPEAKAIGAKRLIMQDLWYWYGFLKARGVRTMIWGDMFLGPGEGIDSTNAKSLKEAKELRSQLPKDVMIADWHYAPGKTEQYTSIKLLADEGFDVVAAPWYSTVNIVNFTSATAQASESTTSGQHALGTMQTTWAGYNFDKLSLDAGRRQYAAYVAAADAAWNGGDLPVDKWDYNYFEAFTRLMNDSGLNRDTTPGWYADLSGLSNVSLKDLGYPWAKTSPFWGRIRFAKDGADAGKGVLLYGQLSKGGAEAPKGLELQIGKKAQKLVFATATPFYQKFGKPIANAVITYTDGSHEQIHFTMGERTMYIGEYRNWENVPEMESAIDPATGTRRYLHTYVWKNPKPGKTIKSVGFSSGKAGCGLALFGLAGLDK